MDKIRWSEWTRNGHYKHGTDTIKAVNDKLGEYARLAKDILLSENADHVLYGIKVFKDDRLSEAQFYMLPLTDERFEVMAASLENRMIYAVHR